MLIGREALASSERKVLADLVSGRLYTPKSGRPKKVKKPETFEEAAQQVARWLKPRGGNKARENLARMIMESPLGLGEIKMIADFVSGQLYPCTGGRRYGEVNTTSAKQKIVQEYRKLRDTGLSHSETIRIIEDKMIPEWNSEEKKNAGRNSRQPVLICSVGEDAIKKYLHEFKDVPNHLLYN